MVGHLWLRVRTLSTEVEAFVFDVEVVEEARGRGLGRATMLAAEQAARELDASVVRLNVFGHNASPGALYESLGYVVTAATMTKRLDGPDDETSTPEPPDGSDLVLREMTAAEFAEFRPRLESRLRRQHRALRRDAPGGGGPEGGRRPRPPAARGTRHPGHLLWTGDGRRPAGRGGVAAAAGALRRDPRVRLRAVGAPPAAWARLRAGGRPGRAQRAARERGVRSVALSVFGFNATARAALREHGFVVTAQTMAKQL